MPKRSKSIVAFSTLAAVLLLVAAVALSQKSDQSTEEAKDKESKSVVELGREANDALGSIQPDPGPTSPSDRVLPEIALNGDAGGTAMFASISLQPGQEQEALVVLAPQTNTSVNQLEYYVIPNVTADATDADTVEATEAALASTIRSQTPGVPFDPSLPTTVDGESGLYVELWGCEGLGGSWEFANEAARNNPYTASGSQFVCSESLDSTKGKLLGGIDVPTSGKSEAIRFSDWNRDIDFGTKPLTIMIRTRFVSNDTAQDSKAISVQLSHVFSAPL